MKTGYSIKTIKYKLRCSHPEWLTETEKYYRQVLDFYFRLLLEHEEIWELNVLQMQGSLERLTIAGRDGRIPEQPLPFGRVPVYFRRSAINKASASLKSYTEKYKNSGDDLPDILRTNIKKSGKVDFGYYWWKGYFHPDSLMFRSSSINQKQKVFRNPLFNDNYITFVFSHSGKIYFLSDVMASYYETDNGIWNGQSRTVGLMRTLIIYEYISYVYGKYKQSNYFRFIPLYYMLLRNSNEFSEERLSPYFQMATECHAEKIAQLKDADKGKLAVKRFFIGIIYRVNAAIKRIV